MDIREWIARERARNKEYADSAGEYMLVDIVVKTRGANLQLTRLEKALDSGAIEC